MQHRNFRENVILAIDPRDWGSDSVLTYLLPLTDLPTPPPIDLRCDAIRKANIGLKVKKNGDVENI